MRSIALTLYLAWSERRAERWANRKLQTRLAKGKEDPTRIDERRGRARMARPHGPLIWFHAASVGEAMSLLDLIRILRNRRDDITILMTTGTVTSAQAIKTRLPDGVIHQYVPVDVASYVTRFVDHWHPDLAIWTESDLWPALVYHTHARGIKMMLINARMSQKSARRWRFLRGFIRAILSRFDIALAQDDETARLLSRLGMARDRIETTGSLKEGATALPADAGQLAQLCDDLGGRPVWCAASTHPGEEHVILAAHQKLLRRLPRALLILVPRHPERGDDLAAIIADMGLAYAQRSMGGRPKAGDQVYLADTLGELGLWYRVAPVSFIGGSLEPIGGHNPFEPALLGSAIIHGPHITNFNDIFTRLAKAKAAWPVQDTDDLAGAIETLLTQDIAAEMAQDALKTVSAGSDIAAHVADLILAHLDKGKP